MGNPHNPKRYGELWPQYKVEAALEELRQVKHQVIVSGGWAWHFLSRKGHKELKHAHDHKDIDIFVPPRTVGSVTETLLRRGFERVWTRYDSKEKGREFRRYEKVTSVPGEKPFKITIDFFVQEVSARQTPEGWLVVEPSTLLGFYTEGHHGSSECFAVQAARKLLHQGIDPMGRWELTHIPQGS
jgi:hypothetical protein